jgi:DNA modification methylase
LYRRNRDIRSLQRVTFAPALSGTTLIAAEKIGRRACLIELDPKYADVIVRRWEEYTGGKAVLEHHEGKPE